MKLREARRPHVRDVDISGLSSSPLGDHGPIVFDPVPIPEGVLVRQRGDGDPTCGLASGSDTEGDGLTGPLHQQRLRLDDFAGLPSINGNDPITHGDAGTGRGQR